MTHTRPTLLSSELKAPQNSKSVPQSAGRGPQQAEGRAAGSGCRDLEIALCGLSRKLLTLNTMLNANQGWTVETEGTADDPKKCAARLLNACVLEIIAISKMPHSPLREITQELLREYESPYYRAKSKYSVPVCDSRSDGLTTRERQVIRYLTEGKCNKEIAAVLHISVRTVEAYRAKTMSKLGAHSLSDLFRFAVRHGISTV
jgi:DNA-binding CsgD family transcriptional regulator